MRVHWIVLLGVMVVVCAVGCRSPEPTPEPVAPPTKTGAAPAEPAADTSGPVGVPLGSVKVGDMAVCCVCVAHGDEPKLEEVKATIDYEGQTYAFCNEAEKAEFISQRTGSGD